MLLPDWKKSNCSSLEKKILSSPLYYIKAQLANSVNYVIVVEPPFGHTENGVICVLCLFFVMFIVEYFLKHDIFFWKISKFTNVIGIRSIFLIINL